MWCVQEKIQRIEQTCTQTALCIINCLTFAVLNAYFIFKKIGKFCVSINTNCNTHRTNVNNRNTY